MASSSLRAHTHAHALLLQHFATILYQVLERVVATSFGVSLKLIECVIFVGIISMHSHLHALSSSVLLSSQILCPTGFLGSHDQHVVADLVFKPRLKLKVPIRNYYNLVLKHICSFRTLLKRGPSFLVTVLSRKDW